VVTAAAAFTKTDMTILIFCKHAIEKHFFFFVIVCKVHRNATKTLSLYRFPNILVLHLKRFTFQKFGRKKLDTNIEFPIHLDLNEFAPNTNQSNKNNKQKYKQTFKATPTFH
jgi:ubiquitin C-terminal hydrolase